MWTKFLKSDVYFWRMKSHYIDLNWFVLSCSYIKSAEQTNLYTTVDRSHINFSTSRFDVMNMMHQLRPLKAKVDKLKSKTKKMNPRH